MLDGCSGCPFTSLELAGGVPHTTAVSRAVATCCPHLTKLKIFYDIINDLPSRAGGASGRREYAAGVVSLLREVGPRLSKLTVMCAKDWPSEGISALQGCRALTSLYVDMEWTRGECYAAWCGCKRTLLKHACLVMTKMSCVVHRRHVLVAPSRRANNIVSCSS